MRKTKKSVKDIGEIGLLGSGAAIGVSALGGDASGLSGATRFLPVTGRVVGIGLPMRMIGNVVRKKKSKWG